MAKYQTIRIVEKIHERDYVVSRSREANALLKFLGNKLRDVQIVAYAKTANIEYFIRYETSDSYEIQVQAFVDNDYAV